MQNSKSSGSGGTTRQARSAENVKNIACLDDMSQKAKALRQELAFLRRRAVFGLLSEQDQARQSQLKRLQLALEHAREGGRQRTLA